MDHRSTTLAFNKEPCLDIFTSFLAWDALKKYLVEATWINGRDGNSNTASMTRLFSKKQKQVRFLKLLLYILASWFPILEYSIRLSAAGLAQQQATKRAVIFYRQISLDAEVCSHLLHKILAKQNGKQLFVCFRTKHLVMQILAHWHPKHVYSKLNSLGLRLLLPSLWLFFHHVLFTASDFSGVASAS